MEKKTILINISDELIERIDRLDPFSDRSFFISNLLDEKLDEIEFTKNIPVNMNFKSNSLGIASEVGLVDSNGSILGKFDINSLEGFEALNKKIQELSEDPAVKIRSRSFI
jgi:hypothetical protein